MHCNPGDTNNTPLNLEFKLLEYKLVVLNFSITGNNVDEHSTQT